MEAALASGMTKAIGVCNYGVHHLQTLLAHCTVTPAINQVDTLSSLALLLSYRTLVLPAA
jgi:diketogulonate reductase-like aldo/keto reductase